MKTAEKCIFSEGSYSASAKTRYQIVVLNILANFLVAGDDQVRNGVNGREYEHARGPSCV